MTEKFAQSLEAGSVPIVIGPPNIRDYEPAPGSILALGSVEDVPAVAARVQHLLQNRRASSPNPSICTMRTSRPVQHHPRPGPGL